eukprot:5010439-Amphidinium_carterae.1
MTCISTGALRHTSSKTCTWIFAPGSLIDRCVCELSNCHSQGYVQGEAGGKDRVQLCSEPAL